MASSSLFFNGALYFKPGSYSKVDASGLATQGLGSSGIVGIVGTAVGGRPCTTMTEKSEFITFSRPGKEVDVFKSGDLYDSIPLAFEPANDEDIPGGAQQVIAMKTNPDTQSEATFANSSGDALVVTSADYGAYTGQISFEILTGTTQGKRLVATLEDIVQTVDNVGGSAYFTVEYRSSTGAPGVGWTTMTMDVLTGGQIRAQGTYSHIGMDSSVTAGLASALTAVSSSASDTTQTLTVYGLIGGVASRRQVTLNGTTPVSLSGTFDASSVFGCILSGVCVGDVTVRDSAVTTLLTVTAGAVQSGAIKTSAFFVNGALTQVASGASTASVWYVGRTASGSVVIDRLALSGTTPVVSSVTSFTSLEAIVLGEVAAARTVTISGKALQTTAATQSTLQKVADYVNARQVSASPDPYGFEFTITTSRTTFAVSLLDLTSSAQNILSPTVGSFYANLNAIVEAINNGMDLVTAEAADGAIGVPDNTLQPTFLSGGSDGTASASDYLTALNLLKLTNVNTIVVLTSDPAIHAYLKAHCNYMCGVGRKERDGVVGIMNDGLSDYASKAETASQILNLNSRHIRVVNQGIDVFNHEGDLVTLEPKFHAVMVAGAQAGSPVGTSLTFKQPNVQAFHQHSGWNPIDDAEEMIQAGLMFMEEVDGIGRRWVRNITSNVGSSNIAFTEASVNQAVNFSVFTFRTAMELAVGQKGFAGTINSTKGVAISVLGQLVDQEILTQYRALSIDLVLDVLEVEAEISPIIPINFVRNVLHLKKAV